jgi:hypothetical protein
MITHLHETVTLRLSQLSNENRVKDCFLEPEVTERRYLTLKWVFVTRSRELDLIFSLCCVRSVISQYGKSTKKRETT